MNGIVLIIPFFMIRFGLLSKLNKEAIQRAAHFAPREGKEHIAYLVYQITNIAILVTLCFQHVNINYSWIVNVGFVLYAIGLMLCTISICNFALPVKNGFHCNGLYQYSRNPMYIAYFVFFIGCCVLTRSYVLFGITMLFQISAHWIILSEERWCIVQFSNTYIHYMRHVNRYIGYKKGAF